MIMLRVILMRIQFSSVTQSCPTLCDPMNHSTPGLPVHHQLLESTQTHVHWVGDAIQPSHPLLSSSPPALNLSQHQSLFKWVSSSHQVAKVLEFQNILKYNLHQKKSAGLVNEPLPPTRHDTGALAALPLPQAPQGQLLCRPPVPLVINGIIQCDSFSQHHICVIHTSCRKE